MDPILEQLVAIVSNLKYEMFPPDVLHAVKRSLVDSFGCAYGSWNEPPSIIARELASTLPSPSGSYIMGTGTRTSPDLAAFVNGSMIRCLDLNDSKGESGGHPSDVLGAIIAACEFGSKDGRALVVGIVTAYEILSKLSPLTHFENLDNVSHVAVASAAGCSAALGMSADETANALSLAVVSNVSLRTTRLGNLSMWKGAAAANASRNGLFAAILARSGFAGPALPFVGSGGFCQLIGVENDEAVLFQGETDYAIQNIHIKRFPCGVYSQSAICAALAIRERHPNGEIRSVHIGTFERAKRIMAGDREKWHPKSRETVDHSIPYVVATALQSGDLRVADFADSQIALPSRHELMKKITVDLDEECVRNFPTEYGAKMKITYASGEVDDEYMKAHPGHSKNPLSDAEIEKKFHALADNILSDEEGRTLLETIWNLESIPSVQELMEKTISSAHREV